MLYGTERLDLLEKVRQFRVEKCKKTGITRPSVEIEKDSKKALKLRSFKAFCVAGAEGLEPSARGFGDRCSTN